MLHLFLDDRPWFKAKRFGLGAYPVTWQGWLLTLAYVGILAAITRLRHHGGAPEALWWTIVTAATLAFVAIARRKTRGGWRWHWGGGRETQANDRGTGSRKSARKPRA